jgi:hypothetical protein
MAGAKHGGTEGGFGAREVHVVDAALLFSFHEAAPSLRVAVVRHVGALAREVVASVAT